MGRLLYQLFSGNYDITPKRDKKQQELYDKIFADLDQIETAFGVQFLDRLLDHGAERETQLEYSSFRSGFRLGVQLMLEALEDQPSI